MVQNVSGGCIEPFFIIWSEEGDVSLDWCGNVKCESMKNGKFDP